MSIHLMNPERMALEAVAEVMLPPPPVDYRQFAIENIKFTDRESPEPGPYNPGKFPEFDEIFAALSTDDPCRIVTLSKSAQIGGTILANIFVLGSLLMDPCDLLYTHPTDDNGRRWSRLKLKPMLRGTTALAKFFPERSRDSADSVMFKERSDGRGSILVSGANSPASLSQISMRRQIQDDLAKWEVTSAGDPEGLADSRSRAFKFAKIFKISTPMILPGCKITKNLESGSHEVPEVPCPHCDAYQVLEWENMKATIEADAEDPHFTCVECSCEIREHHRGEIKRRLRWRAKNPSVKAHHRSFWIWSAYSVLQSFKLIAQEWLSARGDPAKEQTFLNDTCGLPYQAAGETVSWEVLRDRASVSDYRVGVIPRGMPIVSIGIDCQDDRVECHVRAFGANGRRHTVAYLVIPKHISDEGCRTALDELLASTWPNEAGRRITADMVAIDGNAWTEDVWEWARRHPAGRVIMVRGANSEAAPLFARVKRERHKVTGKLLKYSRRFYNFNGSVLKMALYRNLAKDDPLAPGYQSFPQGLDDEFFRQITAERREPVKNKQGFTVYKWVKDPNQANEGLDTCIQAEVAAIRLGVPSMPEATWARLELERETPLTDQQLDLEDLMNRPQLAEAEPPAASPDTNPVRMGEPDQPQPPPASPPKRMSMADLGRRLNGG